MMLENPEHLQSAWRRLNLMFLLLVILITSNVYAQQDSFSFEIDILPLLTKHGCNSGACHGAVAGRGAFFLSLWGSDPKADYDQIVNAFGSRRVRFKQPEDSLLIAKPSGRIAHEGGERFEPDSSVADRLVQWIKLGAPFGTPTTIDALEITATAVDSTGQVPEYRLNATAGTSGSSVRMDATDRTLWEGDLTGGLEWKEHSPPVIRLMRPGRHLITARFAGKTQALVLIAPYPSAHSLADGSTTMESFNDSQWIDEEIQQQLQIANLQALPTVDELTWLRRVSLDLTGRIPTLEEIGRFEQGDPADRKSLAVDRLIQSESFDRYWTFKLARWIGFKPIANEPQASRAFEAYLREEVSRKRSWKQIAERLLLSTGDSHEVGPTNFGRLSADSRAYAELVGRVFMGSRIGCANCHNHPLDRWKQDDYHGLAAILAGIDRGRQVRYVGGVQVTNLRTKEPAIPKLPGADFLPSSVDPQTAQSNVERLSRWLLDDGSHPIFARVLANRLWASMMGRGLVNPVDDFRDSNPASHPRLIERLTQTLIDSDYRPESVLKQIAMSKAYARSEITPSQRLIDPSFFAAHLSKPLEPEVLYDALHDAVGIANQERAIQWIDPTHPSESLDVLGRCSKSNNCEQSSSAGALEANLAKQLHWINGPVVNEAIESPIAFFNNGLAQGSSDEELLRQGYLRILTKRIDPSEVDRWVEEIPPDPLGRQAWFEDWAWSMLSSNRFLSN